jgi:hypothetical protein
MTHYQNLHLNATISYNWNITIWSRPRQALGFCVRTDPYDVTENVDNDVIFLLIYIMKTFPIDFLVQNIKKKESDLFSFIMIGVGNPWQFLQTDS